MQEKSIANTAFSIIRFFAKEKGQPKYDESKVKLMIQLTGYIRQLLETGYHNMAKFGQDNIISVIKVFLIDSNNLLRWQAIKYLRLVMISEAQC